VPVYSHSRIASFEKCPLQYRFRYIDRIKSDIRGIEAFMGNRVHEALEHLYREKGAGRVAPVDEILGVYAARWDAEYAAETVRIVKKEFNAADYQAIGERCLRAYHARHAPFDGGTTLGLEKKFQFALDPSGRFQLMGFIDRLSRAAEGVYEVHDYKTSATLPSAEDLRRDRQLTLYQMAVSALYPDAREIRLIWHYLAHDRDLESRRTEAEIAAHRAATLRLIGAIEAAREHPPHESALCRWCDYRDICPAQKDKAAAERAAEAAAGAMAVGTTSAATTAAGMPAADRAPRPEPVKRPSADWGSTAVGEQGSLFPRPRHDA
jgi:putative RecB family exonuclease